MKKVIVYINRYLSKKERRSYSKDHPGYRLSFRLRYPNALYWLIFAVAFLSVLVYVFWNFVSHPTGEGISIIVLLFVAVMICFIGILPIYFIVWCVCRVKKVDFKEYGITISTSLITSVLCNLAAYMMLMKQ